MNSWPAARRVQSQFLIALLLACPLLIRPVHAWAQQLDHDYFPKQPPSRKVMAARTPVRKTIPAKAVTKKTASKPVYFPGVQADGQQIGSSGASEEKPFTVTVSKTLYLPPAMYGQWSVSGIRLETNDPDSFSAAVNDIWILERNGDEVTVTNPANGATASISVDRSDGNSATFHRAGIIAKNRGFQETPSITVNGDHMFGQSVNKIFVLKNGNPVREYYAVYKLDAQRIGAARTRFRADQPDGGGEPDIEIEDVKPATKRSKR